MEEQGIVGHADGSRPREVLITSMDDVFGNEDDMPPVGDDVTSPVGDAKDDYLSR